METTYEYTERDVEQTLSRQEFIATLRRLADSLERGDLFEIEIDGEKVVTPAEATFSVEHERDEDEEELEFQLKWRPITALEEESEEESEE